MGFLAAQYAFNQTGLTTTQMAIIQRIGWSCLDDTGWLDKSPGWLAEKCGLSQRSLERHLPVLEKLGKIARGTGGFRLPEFVAQHRQIGGNDRQFVRQIVRQIGGAKEEGFQGKGNVGETPPNPPQAGGFQKRRTRRQRMTTFRDPDLAEFDVALCTFCNPPHEWKVSEPYCAEEIHQMACAAIAQLAVRRGEV